MPASKSNGKLCKSLLAAALTLSGISGVAHAATSTERLPALVNETSTQFQLAFRLHPVEAQQRQEQLNAVVAAWRAAPRTQANNERFTAWLRAAIKTSMPGPREALPPIPDFKSTEKPSVKVEKQATEPATTEPAPIEKLLLEPFTPATPTIEPVPAVTESESAPAIEPVPAVTEPAPAIEPLAPTDATTDPFRDDPIDEQEQE